MRGYRIGLYLDVDAVDIYQAGERVPPGIYLPLEGGREVELAQEDALPATFDGHVAVYLRRPESWSEQKNAAKAKHGE
ncbi:MAG: hypothetical protein M3Y28_06125 [Armatimonadota bacterium]|nr:hypothetical protein [Armatimonadota bacterium]